MSDAHRPQWNPTMGRETKAGSQQVSKLALASHTKLKFRQPGQGGQGDVVKRDLKAELAAAERAALDKKRKAQGLPPLPPLQSAASSSAAVGAIQNGEEGEKGAVDAEEEERRKRRRILEEAAELDKDDSDEEDEDDEDDQLKSNGVDKGKGKAAAGDEDEEDEDEDEDDSDEEDSDDEDDTAALMAELAKIKQERAEEKARQDAEAAAMGKQSRDEEIATGNPLLNLQAALGQSPSVEPGTPSSTISGAASSAGTFAVKRRWDDDLIFKNQAVGKDDKPKKGEFVNDLLRSEFHKKFMLKFIK